MTAMTCSISAEVPLPRNHSLVVYSVETPNSAARSQNRKRPDSVERDRPELEHLRRFRGSYPSLRRSGERYPPALSAARWEYDPHHRRKQSRSVTSAACSRRTLTICAMSSPPLSRRSKRMRRRHESRRRRQLRGRRTLPRRVAAGLPDHIADESVYRLLDGVSRAAARSSERPMPPDTAPSARPKPDRRTTHKTHPAERISDERTVRVSQPGDVVRCDRPSLPMGAGAATAVGPASSSRSTGNGSTTAHPTTSRSVSRSPTTLDTSTPGS